MFATLYQSFRNFEFLESINHFKNFWNHYFTTLEIILMTTYHGRHSEVSAVHFLCQPIDFPTSIAEDYSLSDRQGLVQITESIQFPFLVK